MLWCVACVVGSVGADARPSLGIFVRADACAGARARAYAFMIMFLTLFTMMFMFEFMFKSFSIVVHDRLSTIRPVFIVEGRFSCVALRVPGVFSVVRLVC